MSEIKEERVEETVPKCYGSNSGKWWLLPIKWRRLPSGPPRPPHPTALIFPPDTQVLPLKMPPLPLLMLLVFKAWGFSLPVPLATLPG